jgi:hypothetical protein
LRHIERHDGIENGFLIGAGVGILSTWAVAKGSCGNYGECLAGVSAFMMPTVVPATTIAGGVLDFFTRTRIDVVPSADSRPATRRSLGIAPFVSSQAKGVALSMRF